MQTKLSLYNTLSRQKEIFVPLKEGEVSIYVCGPTVYNYIHLGNARPIVFFDTLRRYLAYKGFKVNYVSNFTDVDDKIINRANEEQKSAKAIAECYIKAYFEDTQKLGVLPATSHPRVSDYMQEIIAFVEGLIEKGHAYALDNGDVYYSVRSYEDYGRLSGRDIEDLKSGARVAIDEGKHDPLDFVLWKSAKPNEPSWPSPWGEGRPGWHIECSAMSQALLGNAFDIHGGGQDLIFPHHENELAQSCALHDGKMATYWMHNGFITINEEKMSKSKGNFFLLREILEKHRPEVVRFYLLSVHYRSPLDFDDEKLEVAKKGLERIKNCLIALDEVEGEGQGQASETILASLKANFESAMDDDINTALAISAIFDAVREINSLLKEGLAKEAALALKEGLLRYLEILGVNLETKADEDGLVDKLMNLLIDLRKEARASKNFAQADKIRDELKAIGITLEDGKEKTIWKVD